MKAKFIREVENWTGKAFLCKVTPPMEYETKEERKKTTKYIIVSATHVPFSGDETYIFPATSKGIVINWIELEGSFKGDCDHKRALANAGYTELE